MYRAVKTNLQLPPLLCIFRFAVYYEGKEAMLYVRDFEMIKQVAIRDFDHWEDLGFFPDFLLDIKGNDLGLANTKGDTWKSLKAQTSPAFSLKNLKAITMDFQNCASKILDTIETSAKLEETVDLDKVCKQFSMNCIGRAVFSVDMNATDPNNEFMKKGQNFFSMSGFLVAMFAPWFMWLTNMPIFDIKITDYFCNWMEKILEQRDKMSDPPTDDVLAIMIKARDKKFDDPNDESSYGLKNVKKNPMTNDMIVKTLFQFFLDGYDSLARVLSSAFYFLAINPDALEKAIQEVDEISELYGEFISGDEASALKYMDQVFQECSRLIAFPATYRICTKPWKVPGTNITIPKGMRAMIPIYGIHMDPQYFEEPDKFDPERWSPENKSKLTSGTNLTFGLGPRQCMGMKIARLEMKLFLFQFLRRYRVEPSNKTITPFQFDKTTFMAIEGGVHLKVTKR